MNSFSNFSIDNLVILGPTATGKTKLAVGLAQKLNGLKIYDISEEESSIFLNL